MSGFVKTMIIIAVIGALNWGLVGLFNWNLVEAIFGGDAFEDSGWFSRVLYVIVGIAGIATLVLLPRIRVSRSPG